MEGVPEDRSYRCQNYPSQGGDPHSLVCNRWSREGTGHLGHQKAVTLHMKSHPCTHTPRRAPVRCMVTFRLCNHLGDLGTMVIWQNEKTGSFCTSLSWIMYSAVWADVILPRISWSIFSLQKPAVLTLRIREGMAVVITEMPLYREKRRWSKGRGRTTLMPPGTQTFKVPTALF